MAAFSSLGLSKHTWLMITSLGGLGLTIPTILLIGLWLHLYYSNKTTLVWFAYTFSAIFLVATTKIAFLGWGIGIKKWDFTGFSGHSVLSAIIYPTIFFLITIKAKPSLKILGTTLGLCLALLISYSRIILDAHSLSEIISGFALGAITSLGFINTTWQTRPTKWPLSIIAISFILIIGLLHNISVPSQQWITRIALTLSGHERPYVRVLWRHFDFYSPL